MVGDSTLEAPCQSWLLKIFNIRSGRTRGKADMPRPLQIFRLLVLVAISSWCLKLGLQLITDIIWDDSSKDHRISRSLEIQWPSEEALKKLTLHRVDLEETEETKQPALETDVEEGLKELDYTPTAEEQDAVVDLNEDPGLAKEIIHGQKDRARMMPRQVNGRSYTLSDIEQRRQQKVRLDRMGLQVDDAMMQETGGDYNGFLDVGFTEETEESLQKEMMLKKKKQDEQRKEQGIITEIKKIKQFSDDTAIDDAGPGVEPTEIKQEAMSRDKIMAEPAGCELSFINGFKGPWLSSPDLPRALNCQQYNEAVKLIETVTKMFCQLKFSFVMAFGTLLGSVINHDLIPWDDDLDLAINRPHFLKLLNIADKHPEILEKYNLAYTFTNKNQDKLFFKDKEHIPNTNWSWPFIDLLWYTQNDTHVWIHDPLEPHVRNVTVKIQDFYPLHERPLAHLLLYTPNDPVAMLNSTYGQSRSHMICTGTPQSHMANDDSVKSITVPCPKLKGYYPFVWRKESQTGVKETVFIGNKTLYSIELQEKFYKNFNPYLWKWH